MSVKRKVHFLNRGIFFIEKYESIANLTPSKTKTKKKAIRMVLEISRETTKTTNNKKMLLKE